MEININKASINDIFDIQSLIKPFAENNEMLPKSIYELIECIRDFWIIKIGDKAIACGALHVTWFDIAEIRSLAISKEFQRKGIGSKIIVTLLNEAKKMRIPKVFALTYKPEFFKKFGFKIVDKDSLPKKVWTDCIKCPKFPNCDEIAVEYLLNDDYK
jgi:amino-acid N-acetyltransferase